MIDKGRDAEHGISPFVRGLTCGLTAKRLIGTLAIEEDFVVHDVRAVEGQNGLLVAMPSRKTTEGEFRDLAVGIRKPEPE